MVNEIPPCAQPDSDCAEEVRKGNPPPCKARKMAEEREELIEKIAHQLIPQSREACHRCEKYLPNPLDYCGYRAETGNYDKCWRDEQIALQIASLFPQYVPIEVEMLSDEEIEVTYQDAIDRYSQAHPKSLNTYEKDHAGFRAIAQAQINELTGGKTIYREGE